MLNQIILFVGHLLFFAGVTLGLVRSFRLSDRSGVLVFLSLSVASLSILWLDLNKNAPLLVLSAALASAGLIVGVVATRELKGRQLARGFAVLVVMLFMVLGNTFATLALALVTVAVFKLTQLF